MSLAVIVGHTGRHDFRGLVAGAEHDRQAEKGAGQSHGVEAVQRFSVRHRSVLVAARFHLSQ
jgi:hypothetical protein